MLISVHLFMWLCSIGELINGGDPTQESSKVSFKLSQNMIIRQEFDKRMCGSAQEKGEGESSHQVTVNRYNSADSHYACNHRISD